MRRRRGPVGLLVAALVLSACSSSPADDDGGPEVPPAVTAPEEPAEAAEPAPSAPEPPPTTAPPVEEPTPPPASRAALTADLERLLDEAERRAPDLAWTVLVVDELGREVVARRPDAPELPASTMKQVTAAGALTTLGARARLTTRVEATAGIDAEGRLEGDLVLVGVGDPVLATADYARGVLPARPRTSLDELADQLVEAGLREVTGAVHGTAEAFDDDPLPAGWPERYLSSLDGRPTAGLTVDAGLRTLVRHPQARLRTAAPSDEADDAEDAQDADDDGTETPEVDGGDVVPDDDDLERLRDELADLAEDLEVSLDVEELEAVAGGLGLGGLDVTTLRRLAATDDRVELGPADVRVELVSDPVLHAASELDRLLRERGVVTRGTPRVGHPEEPVLARLAAVESPPLGELLRTTVQRSDNHLAEGLFWLVARQRTGEGSWATADRAARQVLARFGVDATGAVFADGSGLSRDDRLTARQLVDLDRAMTSSARFGDAWRRMQAVTGRSGTLERRLRGTVAEGRFLGKTGTLRDVTALTGQVVEGDAEASTPFPGARRYHLAVLATEADAVGRGAARAATDELLLTLVADLDGCAVTVPDGGDGPLGRGTRTVRCPTG